MISGHSPGDGSDALPNDSCPAASLTGGIVPGESVRRRTVEWTAHESDPVASRGSRPAPPGRQRYACLGDVRGGSSPDHDAVGTGKLAQLGSIPERGPMLTRAPAPFDETFLCGAWKAPLLV